jgi:prefoldin subunit 5
MFSVEDTEKMIASIRAQADALESNAQAMRASADALETAIAPLKLARDNMEQFTEASKLFFDFWQGKNLLTSVQKPGKLDIKI